MRETIDTPAGAARDGAAATEASSPPGAGATGGDELRIAGRTLRSRLLLGTGGFASLALLARCDRGERLRAGDGGAAARRPGLARLAGRRAVRRGRASCCRTRPAVTRRATPCSRRAWRARRSRRTG